VSRLIVELFHPAPPCGEPDNRPAFLSKLHYTYFVQLQLLFTAIAITVISYFTKPRTDEQVVYGLVLQTAEYNQTDKMLLNTKLRGLIQNNVDCFHIFNYT